MDTMLIFYIVLSFVIGSLISYFFLKGKYKDNSKQLADLHAEKDAIIKEFSSKISILENDSQNKVSELKNKYQLLLNDANSQSEKLDIQLKKAIEGKIDEVVKDQLSDVDELKKKIKSLEDELEDNEDDLENLHKKLNKKESDFSDLQSDYEKKQKESDKLYEELHETKQCLEDKVKDLDLKISSLNFIQEILSAKETGSENTKSLYKNVNFFESFIRNQYLDCNAYLFNAYNDLQWKGVSGKSGFENKKRELLGNFEQWASTKRKSWIDGKTTIAFVGEFSAGKTSIVNRILSQDDPTIPQLPVSTKATTAIPTYIAGGPYITDNFVSPDDKLKTITELTFKKVSKEVLDQVKGVSSLIKYFVMTYKNDNLTGMSILDTPGFNSNDSEDKERTIDVINECDALFWVFDVNAGTVNRSSISLIKEKLNKPLYVVINKVDTKAPSEVQKVEKLIKKTLTDSGLDVQQFIKFSTNAKLEDIMTPIKHVSKTAHRDTYVSDIKDDIELMLKTFENFEKEQNKIYHEALKEGENITDMYGAEMVNLRNDCLKAADLPQWKKHLFSKNRFEMSSDDGEVLQKLLETIAKTRIDNLLEIYGKNRLKVSEIQKAWSDLSNVKVAWQKINDCYEQYKKITGKFKE